MTFAERLRAASESAPAGPSLLCVGIDPQPDRTPAGEIVPFAARVIEAAGDYACAFKPQSAFFEAGGDAGWRALKRVVEHVRAAAPHAFVLLDVKRGDVAHTAEAYRAAAFEHFGADAVTLNPYLGEDAIAPFLRDPERGAFVICRTSNPSAGPMQDAQVYADGELSPYYLHVAGQARRWGEEHGNAGLVVGATYPEQLAHVRERCPQMPILLPGIGAQGGDLEASVAAGLDEHGGGLLVSASRSVIYAGGGGAIRAEAKRLRDAIEAERARAGSGA